jgi:alginate O-acetyltransferase complex protein AlgJ
MRARIIGGVLATAVALAAATASPAGDVKALEALFKERCKAMMAERLKGTGEDVLGQEGWVVLGSELAYAALGRFWGADAAAVNPSLNPGIADPVPAIVDFSRQLKARGIRLIFLPVPTRPAIYPEAVLGKEKLQGFKTIPDLNSPQDEFYKVLRSQGVEVLDPTPDFLAARDGEHGGVFIPSESHWTGYGLSLVVNHLGKMLQGEKWLKSVPKAEFVMPGWTSMPWMGHIYKDVVEKAGQPPRTPDTVWLPTVRLKTGQTSKRLDMRNPTSPVVIIGDSNTIWWKDYDASLSQQLAGTLGFPIDVLSTVGGGATNTRLNFVRTMHANPGYVDTKKVVIWCFTARSFRGSGDGWRLIPLDREPPPEETPVPAKPVK